MGENIINTLEERIMDQLDNVSSLAPGSEEETAAIDNLVKLYKLKLEENKIKVDSEEKREQRNCDDTFKRKLVLSILVDTFSQRISQTMPSTSKSHNIVCVLAWEEGRHWQSRFSDYSNS